MAMKQRDLVEYRLFASLHELGPLKGATPGAEARRRGLSAQLPLEALHSRARRGGG